MLVIVEGVILMNYKNWMKLLLIAICGAIIGRSTGFPIGAMLGALIIIAITQRKYKFIPRVPVKVRRVIQVLIGGSLGLTFGPETVNVLSDVMLIALIMPILHIGLALFLSFIIIRILKIDPVTALCSMAPAGVAEMVIISERFKAKLPTVVTIHVFRVIVIISVIPPIILLGL
jgi:membrane AbrB-like protein